MEVDISLADFPFICRICLIRGELRLFEEEYCLWELFLDITKIDVSTTVNFPRNVCNECINRLEEISCFIDVSKFNDPGSGKNSVPKPQSIEYPEAVQSGMYLEAVESKEDMSVQVFQFCRVCSSPKSLILCEKKASLMNLFLAITNINVETDINSSTKSSICNKCVDELEKISSFIDLLFCNNRKLQNVVSINEGIKAESCSDGNAFDVGLSRCKDIKVDLNEIKAEKSYDENSCPYESNDISAMIDIKEENFDSELVASIERNYQNKLELETQSQFGKTVVDLQQHLPEEKTFKCDGCQKKFTRAYNLKLHMLNYTGEKSFKCHCCDKQFTQAGHLKQHMLTHTGVKPYKCDCCKKHFTRAYHLKLHMLNHTGEKPFKCDCCEKRFNQGSHLKQHMLTHTGEKPFKCDCCEKRFTRDYYLKVHMLSHAGEMPYKCDYCIKSFPMKISLKRHVLTHTEKKPFKCDCCDKRFNRPAYLKQHTLTHTGERPLKCDRCEKSFSLKISLKRHMLTHTGEKPFKCDCCEKCFSLKSNLRQHMLTHRREAV